MRQGDGHGSGDVSLQDTQEQAYGLAAYVDHGLADGGQGRAHVAGEPDVVETNDGETLGHAQAEALGVVEDADGHLVVETEDGGGGGSLRQQASGASDTGVDGEIAVDDNQTALLAVIASALFHALQTIATQGADQRTGEDTDLAVAETVQVLHGFAGGGGVINMSAGDTKAGAVFAAVDDGGEAALAAGLHQGAGGLAQTVAEEDEAVGFAAGEHLTVVFLTDGVVMGIAQNDRIAFA